MPTDLREAVRARARGRCDCCGAALPEVWDAHHRQLRSRGGQDTLENLVALIHEHHMYFHAHPDEATRKGLMVHSWEDPGKVPVLRHGDNWQLPGKNWTTVKEYARE